MVEPLLTHSVFPAVLPGIGLALLVLASAIGPRFGRRGGAVIAVLSALWLLGNKPLEGGVLVVFWPGAGLTAADLAGLAGLAVAARLLACGRL